AGAIRCALVRRGLELLGDLSVHHGLGQHPDTLAQKVDLAISARLAEQLQECHRHFVGHRRGPPHRCLSNSMRTTRWPAASTRPFTHLSGHYPNHTVSSPPHQVAAHRTSALRRTVSAI